MADFRQLCLLYNIRRASRAFTKIYEAYLAETGLKATQFGVLAAVGSSSEYGLSISELAGELSMDRTTLSRNIRPLERDNLIEILPGEDPRAKRLQITEEGKAVLAKALPRWRDAQQYVAKKLGDEHLQALISEISTATDVSTTD